jgi:SAM-dependent methyltransferase
VRQAGGDDPDAPEAKTCTKAAPQETSTSKGPLLCAPARTQGPAISPSRQKDPAGVTWNWAAQLTSNDFYSSLVATVEKYVTNGDRFLEVGVGSGYLLSHLSRSRCCRCYGIDVLDDALAAAQRTLRHWEGSASLLMASGFSMPFRNETFDVVASFGVVEHYGKQQSRALLREHARVCRRGGIVLVSAPNALDLAHVLRRMTLGRTYAFWPERSYSPWGLSGELRRVGLRPFALDGYGPFWGLRQLRLAYPLTAALQRLGLLDLRHPLWRTRLAAGLQGMTLTVARKP